MIAIAVVNRKRGVNVISCPTTRVWRVVSGSRGNTTSVGQSIKPFASMKGGCDVERASR